jgi:hypothetical protein
MDERREYRNKQEMNRSRRGSHRLNNSKFKLSGGLVIIILVRPIFVQVYSLFFERVESNSERTAQMNE